MTGADLPRYDPDRVAAALADDAPAPTVVGVVLAAGTSSRFGDRNKLLVDLDGEPVVRRAARTLLDAGPSGVVVVLGHEADRVRAALADLDVRFVHNPAHGDGLSTSVSRGVDAACEGGADAALFLPGDVPDVDPATATLLVDAYRAGLATAVAPTHDGRRGNPVLFDRAQFDALRAVDGDVGGRDVLLDGDRSALVDVDDPGVVADVDTVADLRRRR